VVAINDRGQLLPLGPTDPNVYAEIGNTYARKGEALSAIECYRKCLTLDPNCGPAWNGLGNVFVQLNDLQNATSCYQNAARLQPGDAGAQYNLGRVLDMQGSHPEALNHLLKACELCPTHADAWINLGNVHHHLGNSEKALNCYDRALTLSESPAEVHVNRAMILLDSGDFGQGWREYEYRWETQAFSAYKKRPLGKPQWKGECLIGQRILLQAEQGFGDAIQFARFIPEVTARAAEVFLEVGVPLKELFESLLKPGHVLVRGESLPEFDYHCSLISLPFALNLQFDSIPNEPYLDIPWAAQEDAQRAIHRSAQGDSALRVGICWKGKPTHRWNQLRSVSPAQFAPLADVSGVQWVVLQKDATPEELAVFSERFRCLPLPSKYLEGFLSTAAVIQALDLVISIDTATAHLTGACGKPLWLLLPAFYDWRWHAHLKNSPWYPSAQLFRQKEPGVWASAIQSVRAKLSELVHSRVT
jgi:tetratricopeptide (TPR) repeat protein